MNKKPMLQIPWEMKHQSYKEYWRTKLALFILETAPIYPLK